MTLWGYLLRADDRLDLASPAAGFEWFKSQRWMPSNVEPWSAFQRHEWPTNMHAIRRVANRIRGYRPKQSIDKSMTAKYAEQVFAGYLGKLLPTVHKTGDERRDLSKNNFAGVALIPTKVDDRNQRIRADNLLSDFDVFWQYVFGSFVAADLVAVCESCGRDLPQSKQGKQSRRRRCPQCNWQQWKKRQPKTKLRAKWRADRIKQLKRERNQ